MLFHRINATKCGHFDKGFFVFLFLIFWGSAVIQASFVYMKKNS